MYIVVLNIVRGRNQFSHLARLVLPHDSNGLLQAYLHAAEAPRGLPVIRSLTGHG